MEEVLLGNRCPPPAGQSFESTMAIFLSDPDQSCACVCVCMRDGVCAASRAAVCKLIEFLTRCDMKGGGGLLGSFYDLHDAQMRRFVFLFILQCRRRSEGFPVDIFCC